MKRFRKLGIEQFLLSLLSILGVAFFITVLVLTVTYQKEMQNKYNIKRYEELITLMTKAETEKMALFTVLFWSSLGTMLFFFIAGISVNIAAAVTSFKQSKTCFWLSLAGILLTRFFGLISGSILIGLSFRKE
ncbi:hypothetical protein [Mycoplasmopsis arginini]|uniref:Uncharacterized protein n=1 Tax=Mycoplasmopsis arginini TaxID=2094 RepID=A0AA43QYC0_MYCAR|nr:hypothetical protein [Mycoplasmopsis arginini]MCY2902809.1 hypothetical protein [Mycoplasmopsis arginini QMP CG1-2758]MDI3348108.1 hypothetical protein [Mycoplasmopsis arginini]MDI3348695.1 hypothetical protein [Mycoplasmopsis arginini]MDI3349546.1 hypothetical protein [Mycoplasmopsis arginini]MDI3350014.1 hypothetical protein [Mycoplasmopsis arginini]